MARSSSYTYDPKTGKWTQNTSDNKSSSSKSSNNSNKETASTTTSGGDNLTSSNSDSTSSEGSVEKKYNTIELNTLSGTLNFIVTKETIKLRAGDTVKIKGIGKHLSGNYYVQDVTRQIGSNGYSHSATLIRTDFGKSLKTNTTSTGKSTTQERQISSTPTASNATRTYTVKKGDCLWKIAKDYYGDGSQYPKICDANTGQISNPNLIKIGQVLVIP